MTDSGKKTKQASHAHARAAFTLRISIARVPQKYNSAGQAAAVPVPALPDLHGIVLSCRRTFSEHAVSSYFDKYRADVTCCILYFVYYRLPAL